MLSPSLPSLPQTNFTGVSPEHLAWLLVHDPQDLQDQILFVAMGRQLIVQENCSENSPSCHCHLLGDGWDKRIICLVMNLLIQLWRWTIELKLLSYQRQMLVIMVAVWKNIKKR